ncbi:MAG TPA: hypothetical protein VFI47_01375, partial [Acidimicrobiales bacterium]|nr:hypothetical protein [Acidimicrobiales bacterium]
MPARTPSRVARVARAAVPDAGVAQLGIVAAGTADAAAAIEAVVERLTERGTAVMRVTGRRLERDDDLGAVRHLLGDAPGDADVADPAARMRAHRDAIVERLEGGSAALVVDEAQWLDPASVRVIVGVAERAAAGSLPLIVAHRPVPGDAALATLDAVLGRSQPLAALGPLDESEVGELAAIVLGSAVDDRVVDAVHDQTQGMPGLVELLLGAWVAGGTVNGGRLVAEPGPPGPSVVAALRAEIDQLAPAARTVLDALSAGADLDDELLGATTEIAPDDLGDAIDDLHAAGLVAPGTNDVAPVVAAAVTEMTPVADRRRFHARLAAALAARGAPATRTGEHLAAAGAQGPEAAAAFVAAGDATLLDAPELAAGWYERAIAAGTPPAGLAARRAQAAALVGDAVTALRLADAVVADPAAGDRPQALGVVAALLPSRGFWRRSSAAYRELAGSAAAAPADRTAAAWPLLAGIGAVTTGMSPAAAGPDAAAGNTAAAVDARPVPPAGGPGGGPGSASGMEVEALWLTCDALAASVSPDGGRPLVDLLEAAELLESAHTSLVLPTTPHAIGATVALALSELATAEHLLARARDHDVGGATLRPHHRLGLGWVAVRSGRWAAAQATLDEAKGMTLAPREILLAAAIEAGLARRSGDLSRLSDAWNRAEGVLLRHPADLLSLEIVGELAIGAARLGLWDRVAPKAHELGNVVRSLGEPPLWLLPLRWIGLQVALATDDREAAIRRAAEV